MPNVAVTHRQTHNLQRRKHASGDTSFRLTEDTSFKVCLSHVGGDISYKLTDDTSFKVWLTHAS